MNDAELQVLFGDPDPTEVCERMIQLTNERGGDDNLTAIVALVDGQGLRLPGADESVTQTLQILQEYVTPVESEAAAPSPPPPSPRAAPPTPVTVAPVQPGRTDPPGRAWLVVALVGELAIAAMLLWRYLLQVTVRSRSSLRGLRTLRDGSRLRPLRRVRVEAALLEAKGARESSHRGHQIRVVGG